MKNFILIFVCILVSCCFLGCKNDSIKFNRESKVSELMKNMGIDSGPKVKKSSGIVIYKDEEQKPATNIQNSNFGPHDPNFDMSVRFRN